MSPRRFFLLLPLLLTATTLFSQGPWTQKANIGGYARHRPFTFSIGNRGYLGCGWNGVTMYDDVWEYDPGTNSWMQKANYPSGPRLSAFGFAIGNKGYVGCGLDFNLYVQNDFYEYNPATNTWTPKAPWIGTPIFGASSAVVNNIGYVVCGDDWDLGYFRHQEMYSYNPTTNAWSYVTNFPADGRRDPCAFVINNKIYVGTGSDNTYTDVSDWWEYNPATNAWSPKAPFAGTPRSQAVAFGVMGKGYLGTGGQLDENDFWEYDATANAWNPIDAFPGQGRENSSSFVIGNIAYMACGTSGTNYADCWEFNALNITGVNENLKSEITANVFPNPMISSSTLKLNGVLANQENELMIFSSDGKCVVDQTFSGDEFQIQRGELAAGTYLYQVISGGKRIFAGKLQVQ